ncbi:MAG: dihydrodipicolinate synthase family protein [Candidatus Zixiibacteriota bacterium]
MRTSLQGIITVCPTPLNEDETLDAPAFQRIIEYTLAGGVHGLWVLGSAGELPNLNYKDRRRAIKTAVEVVNGRVPVIVGVGHTGTRLTIEAAQEAKKLGADIVNVVPPYYFKYGEEHSIRHYQLILEAIELPLVIYRWGSPSLSLSAMAKLCEDPKVVAIKDVPTEFRVFQEMVALLGPMGVSVFTASGQLIHPATMVGGHGAAALEAAIAPKLCVSVYEAARENRNEEAATLQQKLSRLSSVLFTHPHEGRRSSKAALVVMGLCKPFVTAPFEPATPQMLEEIRGVLSDLDLI